MSCSSFSLSERLLLIFSFVNSSGEIASKPLNPQTDNYQSKIDVQNNIRENVQEYKNFKIIDPTKKSVSAETIRAQM